MKGIEDTWGATHGDAVTRNSQTLPRAASRQTCLYIKDSSERGRPLFRSPIRDHLSIDASYRNARKTATITKNTPRKSSVFTCASGVLKKLIKEILRTVGSNEPIDSSIKFHIKFIIWENTGPWAAKHWQFMWKAGPLSVMIRWIRNFHT